MKRCPRCGETKELICFSRNRCAPDGRQTYCKPCCYAAGAPSRQRRRERLKTDPEYLAQEQAKRSAWGKARYRKGPDQYWASVLRTRYGLSVDDYESMLADQRGVCAACKECALEHGRKRLCVDHDHRTGRVRGLLCGRCNRAIGLFDDNPWRAIGLFAYLTAGPAWRKAEAQVLEVRERASS